MGADAPKPNSFEGRRIERNPTNPVVFSAQRLPFLWFASVPLQSNSPPDFDADFRARLIELLRWRRDVRRFRCTPLPDGTVERLIAL